MKKKILIADDDQAILEAVTLILELEGYEVQTTQNGTDVEKLSKHLPDLILLDIWMSGHDGKVICKSIKTNKKTKHIPVILISANKGIGKIAEEVGADGFLSKPFDMNDLLGIVATHTSKA